MLIAVCINLSPAYYSSGNVQKIICVLIIVILICYSTYHAIKRFIKVTVTPDVLSLQFLLINYHKTVNYTDIVHASVVQNAELRRGDISSFTLGDTKKLKIELSSGEKLYLFEEYYQNFDELKEAIRRARFKLD